jgi:hypothetical protein
MSFVLIRPHWALIIRQSPLEKEDTTGGLLSPIRMTASLDLMKYVQRVIRGYEPIPPATAHNDGTRRTQVGRFRLSAATRDVQWTCLRSRPIRCALW